MTEPHVVEAMMNHTVAWVRDGDTIARMKPLSVAHFVNGLNAATQVIDRLVEQRQQALMLLVGSGISVKRALEMFPQDEVLEELYPIDAEDLSLDIEKVNTEAQELYNSEREVPSAGWVNVGSKVRGQYRKRVILGAESE